jgi:sugar phosphate isomerase/epimerase
MMRLAVITDEIGQDFAYTLDVLREYGLPGAEIRTLWGVNVADLSDAQVDDAHRLLLARGIACAGLATPLYKCDLDPESAEAGARAMHGARSRTLAEQAPVLERCLAIARRLEAPALRIFAFWRQGDLTPDLRDRIAAALRPAAERAAQDGVILALENEPSCCVGTGTESAAVVGAVDHPNLRCCWDAGNGFYAGETAYPDGYERVRPFLAHFHIKDVRRDGAELKPAIVGEGVLPFPEMLAALRRDGYTGWVSLETEHRPDGDAARAEESTRRCIPPLIAMAGAA